MARALPSLRTLVGAAPFALILATLGVFAYTRDAMVFAVGGLFACVYVLAILLVARRKRRAKTKSGGITRRQRRLLLRRR